MVQFFKKILKFYHFYVWKRNCFQYIEVIVI